MSPTKSTWTAWNRSTWAITSPIEQTFCWTEPKRHLKLENRVKRESNQDAEGCDQLGLVKNRGATTSVGPPFQHPSVLTGSDIFPEGKQDPHLLQLTKLWQVIQFSIQIIKDAMNRGKEKEYMGFSFQHQKHHFKPQLLIKPRALLLPLRPLGALRTRSQTLSIIFLHAAGPKNPNSSLRKTDVGQVKSSHDSSRRKM